MVMGMREKLIEVMEDTRANAAWHRWGYEESADYLIANDVVPVVRCKDCKHKTVTSDGMVCECALPTKRMQDYYIYGSTILARVEPDAFCSYGERRTDER
jgi:hypothetical protein